MKKRAMLRVLGYARRYWLYLAGAIGGAVVSVALTLLAPVIIGAGVDLILGPGQVDFQGLTRIIGILALVILGSALFQWLMGLCTNAIAYRTVRDLRMDIFRKLEQVPLKVIDSRPHGDLISRVINDIDVVSDGLLQGFSQLFTGIVTIVGTLLFMLSVSVPIALVVVVVTPLSLGVAAFIAKRSYTSFQEQSACRGELSGYVEEMLGSQKVVKAFGYEQRAQQKFEEINSRLYRSGVKSQFFSSMTNPCTRFVNGIVYAAVGVAGALAALSGVMTVGQISCFLTYANQYTKPFNEISGVVTELQSALASAARVFEILDEPDEPEDRPNARIVEHSRGQVSLRDVSFRYRADTPLIDGLNLKVASGQRIAIVGPTGCGKTTMINLLMRFYDVTGGRIDLDGWDIRDLTRSSLRAQYGMVLQESWIFSGTVRENIAYGRPGASQEEIEAAARAAHAHGFIMRMPQGYDTPLAEGGSNISQGQKQLLCIARVMLTQPAVLILDEATSSIDTRTELRVQQAFNRMMKGRTSFVVAHRLSTIREADNILVMRDGHIIEQGRHEALLKQGGFYAKLYYSQFKGIQGETQQETAAPVSNG
jgi:ATP-binding cassette subfamily B multidrug efflux pump